jgi:hypothetical protein
MKKRAMASPRLGLLGALCALLACGGAPAEAPQLPLSSLEQAARSVGGSTRWARHSLGPELESAQAVAVDRTGNTFMVGSYSDGPADFGSGPLPAPLGSGGARAFLAAYAPEGTPRWSRSFGSLYMRGSTSPVTAFSAVAVDRAGNLVVFGRGSWGTDLGSGPMPEGSWLAQFAPDGSLLWCRIFYGELGPGGRLALDADGGILLAGSLRGTVNLGGGPRTGPTEAAFVARYDARGLWLWDRVFGTAEASRFEGLATDDRGNVYVAGSFAGEASFGGDTFTSPAGARAPVLAKYSPAGEHLWSRSLGGMTGEAGFRGVAVTGRRVFATGSFSGGFHFNGATLSSSGAQSGLLLAYDTGGAESWGRALGAEGVAVAIDSPSDGVVLGFAAPGDELGTGPVRGEASRLLFVAKFAGGRGEPRWVRTFAADSIAQAGGLAVARDGESLVTGSLTGPTDFGAGPLIPEKTSAFLLRLHR